VIISLQEAREIDPALSQGDLDAFEQAVRQLTANNFQNPSIRFYGMQLTSELHASFSKGTELLSAIVVGDTLQVHETGTNDGLFVVEEVGDTWLKLSGRSRLYGDFPEAVVTLVEYPADIRRGISKLIKYDLKMRDKLGIKSETISRMSLTYADVNAGENVDGYPAALLDFLRKYIKIRWG
jgi:hypothetical protein